MRLLTASIALVAMGLAGTLATAQQPATSVQLPTFSYFGVSTSVLAPDRGSAYLGGVNRAQSGSRQFGSPLLPFSNRSSSHAVGGSSTRVSVWIHDLNAMDEALLNQSASYQAYLNGTNRRGADGWQQRLAESRTSAAGQATPSLEEVRQQRIAAEEARAGEAAMFFQRARLAEEAGKANVAKIYYQMVARRATGELKDQALARLEAIRGAKEAVAARDQ